MLLIFGFSRNVTNMPLFSALEDLQETTLEAIRGWLRRLEYVSALRDRAGGYDHWGLARVYGEETSKKALAEAHRALLSRILATPFRALEDDALESSGVEGTPAPEYLDRLSRGYSQLLPPNPGAGSGRHLNSVLHALSSLLKNQRADANRPT